MTEKGTVYLVVTNRDDCLISGEVARLLAAHRQSATNSCRIYFACPKIFQKGAETLLKSLEKEFKADNIIFENVIFDPGETKESCYEAANDLVGLIGETRSIDGLVFNWHGSIPGRFGEVVNESGVLFIVQYKVLGLVVLLETLIKKKILSDGSRVVVAGSEAARGIPDMKFPAPDKFGESIDSFTSVLNGSAFDLTEANPIYAHVEGILSLYIAAMARRHPGIYFCSHSPGFTQDSLNLGVSLETGYLQTALVYLLKYVLWRLLVKSGAAQDYTVAAQYFFEAVTGAAWAETMTKYPSGVLLGAADGVTGKICNQSTITGGAFLSDKTQQDLAFEALHKFL